MTAFRYDSYLPLFDQTIALCFIYLCIKNGVNSHISAISGTVYCLVLFVRHLFSLNTCSTVHFVCACFKWLPYVWFHFKPAISCLSLSSSSDRTASFQLSVCLWVGHSQTGSCFCRTVHYSAFFPLSSSDLHWSSRLRVFCCNIPVISERQIWKRIYHDLCSTCWEDVIELSCSSLLF